MEVDGKVSSLKQKLSFLTQRLEILKKADGQVEKNQRVSLDLQSESGTSEHIKKLQETLLASTEKAEEIKKKSKLFIQTSTSAFVILQFE